MLRTTRERRRSMKRDPRIRRSEEKEMGKGKLSKSEDDRQRKEAWEKQHDATKMAEKREGGIEQAIEKQQAGKQMGRKGPFSETGAGKA